MSQRGIVSALAVAFFIFFCLVQLEFAEIYQRRDGAFRAKFRFAHDDVPVPELGIASSPQLPKNPSDTPIDPNLAALVIVADSDPWFIPILMDNLRSLGVSRDKMHAAVIRTTRVATLSKSTDSILSELGLSVTIVEDVDYARSVLLPELEELWKCGTSCWIMCLAPLELPVFTPVSFQRAREKAKLENAFTIHAIAKDRLNAGGRFSPPLQHLSFEVQYPLICDAWLWLTGSSRAPRLVAIRGNSPVLSSLGSTQPFIAAAPARVEAFLWTGTRGFSRRKIGIEQELQDILPIDLDRVDIPAAGGCQLRSSTLNAVPRVTLILMSYSPDRHDNQLSLLNHYAAQPLIDRILFLWNSGVDSLPPIPSPMHPKLKVLVQPKNSLNNRYNPALPIETDAVVMVDDDVRVEFGVLWALAIQWQSDPSRLIGVEMRYAGRDQYDTKCFNKAPPAYCNMVLPKAVIMPRSLFEAYSAPDLQEARDFVDSQAGHCDDVLLNYVAAREAGKPVVALSHIALTRMPEGHSALWKHTDRKALRQECAAVLAKPFSKLPGPIEEVPLLG